MRIGIEFAPNVPVRDIVEYAKLAEKNDIEYLWLHDHYNDRNAYVILSQVATATKRINLGPGVTNTFTINPAVTASAIATLDEISEGRAILGIGTGDLSILSELGIPVQTPVARLRDGVEIIRQLFKAEKFSYKGKVFYVNDAGLKFKTRKDIPIYIGAQGPAMLKMAGEIGDGCIINASSPVDLKQSMNIVKLGFSEKRDFDMVAYTTFSIDKNENEAKRAVIPMVAFIVAGSPEGTLRRHTIPIEDIRKIKSAFYSGDYKSTFSAVTDQMIEAFSISGNPEDIKTKISLIKDIGITQLIAGDPVGPNKENSIKLIGKHVTGKF